MNAKHCRMILTATVLACLMAAGANAQVPICHNLGVIMTSSSNGSCTGAAAGDVTVTHSYAVTCTYPPGPPYYDSISASSACGGGLYVWDCAGKFYNENEQFNAQGNYSYFAPTSQDGVATNIPFVGAPQCAAGPTHTAGTITCPNTCCSSSSVGAPAPAGETKQPLTAVTAPQPGGSFSRSFASHVRPLDSAGRERGDGGHGGSDLASFEGSEVWRLSAAVPAPIEANSQPVSSEASLVPTPLPQPLSAVPYPAGMN